MAKIKFKNGIRPVHGSSGKWDVNYQVNGIRFTKRINAKDRDEALAWRQNQKSSLRSKVEGNGNPAVDLTTALEKLKKKVKSEIEQGVRGKTALSEVVPPFRRFFFDYPEYLGKVWTTTADITPFDLEGYKEYYSSVLKKPKGLSTEIGKIQNILTHFRQLNLISSIQLFEFRQVKRPHKNIKPFIGNSESDFVKVLLWIKKKKPRLYEFLCFITNTGRRPKEVRRYLREYVNLDQNFIYVQKEITKNKKQNWLHLSDELKKDVMRAVDFSRKLNSKYLFLNDHGRPFSANNPQVHFKEAARACGMTNWDKWSVYHLKKRFITYLRSVGKTTEAISQVSGHSDLDSVIKSYSFPDIAQSEEVLKAGRLRV